MIGTRKKAKHGNVIVMVTGESLFQLIKEGLSGEVTQLISQTAFSNKSKN